MRSERTASDLMYDPVVNPLHNPSIALINPVAIHRAVYANQPSLPVMYGYTGPFYFPYFPSYVPTFAFPNIFVNTRVYTHYQPLTALQVLHGIFYL